MRINRIYWPDKIIIGRSVVLTDDTAHRLLHVLRLKTGHKLSVFNEMDGEHLAEIDSTSRHQVSLNILEFSKAAENIASLNVHLLQGISKSDKMDWAIQKACELGVSEITPMLLEHTHIKKHSQYLENKHSHWQKVLIHACEQSGRIVMPKINPTIGLREWLIHREERPAVFLTPRNGRSFDSYLDKIESSIQVELYIGGEGGFSEDEENLFNKKGFMAVGLGPRILRTETATVAALSIMQFLWGDMKL